MPYTEEQQFKIQLVRDSLQLQEPELETDEAYRFTDEQIWAILTVVTPVHFPEKGPDDITGAEFYFPLLLAKREIYYRLATSTAPFYPLEAEGASLEKNVRFDHYLALIKQVENEYKNAMDRLMDTGDQDAIGVWVDGVVETYEVILLNKYYYQRRNYRASKKPDVALTVSGITQTTANLDWEQLRDASQFVCARIYLSTEPIIDEYDDKPLPDSKSATYYTHDYHRTKFRLKDLQPDTEYYVAMITETPIGPKGYDQQQFRTLAIPVEEEIPVGENDPI